MVRNACGIPWQLFAATVAICWLPERVVAFARTSIDHRRTEKFEAQAAALVNHAAGVLLIDGDNVRGKSAFTMSHEALLARTARWATQRGLGEQVIILVDHGSMPTAYHLPRLAGVSMVFSGPELSADDVLARDIPWFHRHGHDVLLVTADSGLAQRCRRAASGRSMQIAPPQAFLAAIGHDTARALRTSASSTDTNPSASFDGAVDASTTSSGFVMDEARLRALEGEMRARAALTRADRQVARVGRTARKATALTRQRKELRQALDTARQASASVGAPSLEQLVQVDAADGVLGSRGQESWMRALIARRAALPAERRPTEHTYERVILAETLRRRLRHRLARSEARSEANAEGEGGGSIAQCYAAAINGDAVPLVVRRPLAQVPRAPRESPMPSLPAVSADGGDDTDGDRGGGRRGSRRTAAVGIDGKDRRAIEPLPLLVASSAADGGDSEAPSLPLRSLFVGLRDATRPIEGSDGGESGGGSGSRRERRRRRRHATLELYGNMGHSQRPLDMDAAPVPTEPRADRTDEVPSDPLPRETSSMPRSPAAEAHDSAGSVGLVDVARLLVVSDTHGWADELLCSAGPLASSADVLIHCGDFCGGAGRAAGDEVAVEMARLDSWLSRQPQPTKLVLRGNHDPSVGAFPLSGARYVTSPTTVEAANVTFALVPYFKGPLRGHLPTGDVLVTHEPPKRVLDRTCSGEDAGDESLRAAVRPPSPLSCMRMACALWRARGLLACVQHLHLVARA